MSGLGSSRGLHVEWRTRRTVCHRKLYSAVRGSAGLPLHHHALRPDHESDTRPAQPASKAPAWTSLCHGRGSSSKPRRGRFARSRLRLGRALQWPHLGSGPPSWGPARPVPGPHLWATWAFPRRQRSNRPVSPTRSHGAQPAMDAGQSLLAYLIFLNNHMTFDSPGHSFEKSPFSPWRLRRAPYAAGRSSLTFRQSQQLKAPLPATQLDRKRWVFWQHGVGALWVLSSASLLARAAERGILFTPAVVHLFLHCALGDLHQEVHAAAMDQRLQMCAERARQTSIFHISRRDQCSHPQILTLRFRQSLQHFLRTQNKTNKKPCSLLQMNVSILQINKLAALKKAPTSGSGSQCPLWRRQQGRTFPAPASVAQVALGEPAGGGHTACSSNWMNMLSSSPLVCRRIR